MIEYVKGDSFDYKANIRINTVNCVGVMGAGIALEFKTRYPEMFKAYVDVCKRKEIAPGRPFLWEEADLFSSCIIVNLPTKLHWRNPSKYEYIEHDLVWLKDFLQDKNSEDTVTLPALGCGRGGLDWGIVKDKINHYLSDSPAKILVFEPASPSRRPSGEDHSIGLQEANVSTIYPGDENYPSALVGKHNKEIYCKGNVKILNNRKISLILGNTISEKEKSAIYRILEEVKREDLTVALSVNNKKQLELAKVLLEKGYKLIMIVPCGILRFKHDDIPGKYKDSHTVLSFLPPVQEFNNYESANSLKRCLELADVVLYCCENTESIKKNVGYLKGHDNLFYINFGEKSSKAFTDLEAKKISINAITQKPNVTIMQHALDRGIAE